MLWYYSLLGPKIKNLIQTKNIVVSLVLVLSQKDLQVQKENQNNKIIVTGDIFNGIKNYLIYFEVVGLREVNFVFLKEA